MSRVRQSVDTAQNRLSRCVAIGNVFCHDLFLLAATVVGTVRTVWTGPNSGQHLVFVHDQVVDAVKCELVTGVLAKQDGVALLQVQRNACDRRSIGLAVTRRDDRAALAAST